MSIVGKRLVELRGTSYTLRTFTEGSVDADHGDPTEVASDTTVRAIFQVRGSPSETEDVSGEQVLHDGRFVVRDGDEPTVDDNFRPPEFVAVDGGDYVVEVVGPPEQGARTIFCRRKR